MSAQLRLITSPEDTRRLCTGCKVSKHLTEYRNQKLGRDGKQAVCRECDSDRCRKYKRENRERLNDTRRDYTKRNPKKTMLWSARERAKKFGVAFSIDESDIAVPDYCPVLGIRLQKGKVGDCDTAPSLDRINPKRGYVPGNVAVISRRANRFKSDASVADVERVLAWMKSVGAP